MRPIGDHVQLRGADSATVLISVASDFRHEDFAAQARRSLDAAAALPYAELRDRHVVDHRAAFGGSTSGSTAMRISVSGRPTSASNACAAARTILD